MPRRESQQNSAGVARQHPSLLHRPDGVGQSPLRDAGADYRPASFHAPDAAARREFHLHPSLFRLDALIACLELLVRQDKPTPWGFEKICDKPDADLPEEFKAACYQVCGEELALNPPGPADRLRSAAERFFYHRMMNLYSPLNRVGLGMKFWDGLGFDDFFYNGPLPMFYSGIMSRGRVNPFFLRYLHSPGDPGRKSSSG